MFMETVLSLQEFDKQQEKCCIETVTKRMGWCA